MQPGDRPMDGGQRAESPVAPASHDGQSPPAGRRWAGRLRRGGSCRPRRCCWSGWVVTAHAACRRPAVATRADAAVAAAGRRSAARPRPVRARRRAGGGRAGSPAAGRSAAGRAGRCRRGRSALLPGERTLARRVGSRWSTPARWPAWCSACSRSSWPCRATSALAALCLIACVIFDGLDGALARKLGVASPFGAQMDSLADMCSFGLAAPVVVYASLAARSPSRPRAVAPARWSPRCAAIRLARFNVSPKDGRFFCGVPTTMAAAVLALGRADRPAGARRACRSAGVALLAVRDGLQLPVRQAGPPGQAAALAVAAAGWSARWSTSELTFAGRGGATWPAARCCGCASAARPERIGAGRRDR